MHRDALNCESSGRRGRVAGGVCGCGRRATVSSYRRAARGAGVQLTIAPRSMPNVCVVFASGMADGAFPREPISCDVATRDAMPADMRKKVRRPILNVRNGLSTSARMDKYF